MSIRFAWRSDTSTAVARYSHGSPIGQVFTQTYASISGAIGGSAFTGQSTSSIVWPGLGLFTAASTDYTILIRFSTQYNGNAPFGQTIFSLAGGHRCGTLNLSHETDGDFSARRYNLSNSTLFKTSTHSATSDSFVDYVMRGHFGQTAGGISAYKDGVLDYSIASFSFDWILSLTSEVFATINAGPDGTVETFSQMRYNEIVIWDEIVDPTNVTLVSTGGTTSTGQTLDGSSRTGWVDVASLDGTNWTSITAAQIASGVEQIQAGLTQTGALSAGTWTSITAAQIAFGINQIQNDLTQTGSLVAETWSTITAAEIKLGINQIQNSSTITGTFNGPSWTSLTAAQIKNGVNQIQADLTQTGSFAGEVWSTITAAQIQIGVEQIQNSSTITGTLNSPVAVSGTSTTLNIPNIKEQIRFVLADNNTTSSSILDLSANLSRRVQKVFTLNPENIRPQASLYPCICVYTDSKSIEAKTIATNQVNGKRQGTINFSIVGMVWNQDFGTEIFNDPADDDLENLMENTEKILRHHHTLGDNVKWQIPTDVTYHNAKFDEQTHFRVGFLTLQARFLY